MKTKITIFIVLLLFVLTISLEVNAYSTSNYSIDIPENWNKSGLDGFVSKDRTKQVNIGIEEFEFKNENPYTKKNLEYLTEEMSEALSTQLGKIDSFEVKEITKCTKNKYKCFHMICNYTMLGQTVSSDCYVICTKEKTYMLSIYVKDKDDLNSTEIKNIINSFTIKNYEALSNSGAGIGLKAAAIIVSVSGAIIGIIIYKKQY